MQPLTLYNKVISRLQGFTNVLVGFVSVQRSPPPRPPAPLQSEPLFLRRLPRRHQQYRLQGDTRCRRVELLIHHSLPFSRIVLVALLFHGLLNRAAAQFGRRPIDQPTDMHPRCSRTLQLDDLPERAKQFSRLVIRLAVPTNYLSPLLRRLLRSADLLKHYWERGSRSRGDGHRLRCQGGRRKEAGHVNRRMLVIQ